MRLSLAVLLLLLTNHAVAQRPTGSGDFVFTPRTNPPLTVYYHLPRNATDNSPIVFALHGLSRQGANVRNAWAPNAEQYGFILITPQFDNVAYKGSSNYNIGRVITLNPTES